MTEIVVIKFILSYNYQTQTLGDNMSDHNFQNNFPKMPEFKVNQNKNGYEIRTDILGMAKDLVEKEYSMKFAGWELSAKKDPVTGELVNTVSAPEFPGLEQILATAEKMYGFVNQGATKK